MKKTNFKALILVVLIFIGVFTACEKSDDISSSGKLKILLTDAPFPTDLVEEANVTIDRIDIRILNEDCQETHGDDNPGDGICNDEDCCEFILLSEEVMEFNLLDLTNGVTANLLDTEIEPGTYDLIRLHVSEASIKLKDGQVFDLKIPSGMQSGLKIKLKPAVEITSGLSEVLLFDFDVSRSFVVQGNPYAPNGIKGFIFKPVIKATKSTTAGTLMGIVTDEEKAGIEGVEVAIIAADTVYTKTFTDETGGYMVLGVEEGTYKVEFAKEGYETVLVEGIQIMAGNTTTQDAELTAVAEEETTE